MIELQRQLQASLSLTEQLEQLAAAAEAEADAALPCASHAAGQHATVQGGGGVSGAVAGGYGGDGGLDRLAAMATRLLAALPGLAQGRSRRGSGPTSALSSAAPGAGTRPRPGTAELPAASLASAGTRLAASAARLRSPELAALAGAVMALSGSSSGAEHAALQQQQQQPVGQPAGGRGQAPATPLEGALKQLLPLLVDCLVDSDMHVVEVRRHASRSACQLFQGQNQSAGVCKVAC